MSEEIEVEVTEEETEKSENGAAAESIGEDVKALASAVARKATEEAFIEIPVTADEEGGEKTDDQVTEIEEDKGMSDRPASLDEFRDIPVGHDDAPDSKADEESIIEVSVVEDLESDQAAAKEEPPSQEAAPERSSPTGTRKKVTVEESPPVSPVKKDSGSPLRKEPSWWKNSKQPEEEAVEAESVEEQKSKSEDFPPPSEPKEEPKEPSEPSVHEAAPKPAQDEFYEIPVEAPREEPVQEPSVHEEAPKQEEFYEVPVVAEEPVAEERSKVTFEPALSPPRQSRRDRAELEEERRQRAPVDTTPAPIPIPRAPSYITYSSWAPAVDYRTTYIPSYSSYYRGPGAYQQASSDYTRPGGSLYLNAFDAYVRTGAFGQSSYAADRLRTRSRSRDRGLYTYSGYYTPPPLRRNREYSLPSRYAQPSGSPSSAPSRSGSFVNFMDYIVTTDRNLRRSASRSSSISRDDYEPLSRSASRVILPTPADTINYWYTKQISHVDSYVKRLNEVYDNNVHGYYSRYNTSRPFTGYLTAGLGDYGSYNRSWRGHSSDLERRLATSKTYLRAYDLTRLPRTAAHLTTMKRSIFW